MLVVWLCGTLILLDFKIGFLLFVNLALNVGPRIKIAPYYRVPQQRNYLMKDLISDELELGLDSINTEYY